MQHATAVAVDRLLQELPIDLQRVYMTANASATPALWSVAAQLPGRFAAVVPFNPSLSNDPALASALSGTRVRMITGVEDGMATDRANRMNDFLATIQPPCEVVYEMNMGSEASSEYYQKPALYRWLLTWHRLPGQMAEEISRPLPVKSSNRFDSVALGVITMACAGAGVIRLRRRKAGK